jgi:tetraacyldisaccharide-1-P 4'-kinase
MTEVLLLLDAGYAIVCCLRLRECWRGTWALANPVMIVGNLAALGWAMLF